MDRTDRRSILRVGALLAGGSLAGCTEQLPTGGNESNASGAGAGSGSGSGWQQVAPPMEGGVIYDLEFVDDATGWAAVGVSGYDSKTGFYYTEDAGATWTRKKEENARAIAVAREGSRIYGFGTGDASDFWSWYSDDGGENWEPIPNDAYGMPETPKEAYFFTDQEGFFTSQTGRRIQRTTDGGRSFEQVDLKACSPEDVAVVGDDVWTVGNGEAKRPNGGGCLMHSPARGKPGSWSVRKFRDEAHDRKGGRITGVYAPGSEELWAVGRARQIYHTTDGGTEWTQVEGVPTKISSFTGIDGRGDHLVATALTEGSASGQAGLTYESTDGGKTWSVAWEPEGNEAASFGEVEYVASGLAFAYSEYGDFMKFTGRN